jgi:hypothetical protein
MAERLLLFADVYNCTNISEQLKAHIEQTTRSHLEKLVGGDVYRPRTNHGLMVDKAMLCVSRAIPAADPDAKHAEVALRRCAEQVAWLFTAEGATREHSVSYQEYNLNVCLELRDALVKADIGPELVASLDRLLRDGQELLAHATDAAGRYLPLGDSFREHNPDVIAAFRRRGILDQRLAYALSRGVEGTPLEPALVVYPEAGFAFIRKGADPSRSVQLAMTAAWHSDVHKQADDLSFVLSEGHRELIVDAGYSDRREGAQVARSTRSELAHNVVLCRDRPWRAFARQDVMRQTRLTHYHASPDLIAVRGQHARIERASVQRTIVLIDTSKLLVFDAIESELAGEFCQQFHLAPGLVATETDGSHCVYDMNGQLHARFNSVSPARVEIVNESGGAGAPVCVRWRDRSETEPTSCLVSSAAVGTRSSLLLAQLIELGPALASERAAQVVIESVTADRLAFELTQSGQARTFRIQLDPLPAGRLRWPR